MSEDNKILEIKSDINPQTGKPKYMTYAERYKDPEYRKKQKEKLMTRITCECGIVSYRANMSHHRKSARHIKLLEEKKQAGLLEREKLTNAIEKLREYVKENNLENILKI